MKRFTFCLALVFTMSYSFAQDTLDYRVAPKRLAPQPMDLSSVDTSLVINDMQGKPYKYALYSRMVNSGAYTILKGKSKPVLVKTEGYQNLVEFNKIRTSVAIKSPNLANNTILNTDELTRILGSKELENKAIVLYFWSSDNKQCLDNFKELNKIFELTAKNKNVAVIAITTDNNQKAMTAFQKNPFPYADKVNHAIGLMRGYMVDQYPSYVVTDKSHKIRFTATGTDPAILTGLKISVLNAMR